MNARSAGVGKTITSLKMIKKKKNVEVSFGLEKIILSEDVFTNYLLYVGKEVPLKEYWEMKRYAEEESLYQYGLNLALKGIYSTYEAREKIKSKAKEGQNPYEIISRLKQIGLLNDCDFAKQYAEEKTAQLYGENRIKDDLLHKKVVDPEIVSHLLFQEELPHAKKYASMIEKKYERLPLKAKRQKAIMALQRRGYAPNICHEAVKDYQENKTAAKKSFEMDFAHTKARYERKYEGYELKQHIYAALLRKGYPNGWIQEKMEETKWKRSKN